MVDKQVSAGNFDAALSQCKSCCDFLPESGSAECQTKCSQAMPQEQIAERMVDQAKEGARSAKEQWKEALRLLREMADRETAAVQTITP